MKRSIRFKMTLLVAVSIVAMMGLWLVASLFLAEPVMIGRQRARIEKVYGRIEREYSEKDADLAGLLRDYEDGNAMHVEIYDQTGALLYTSGRRMEEGFGSFFPNIRPGRLDLRDFSFDPQVMRSGGEREMLSLRGIFVAQDGALRYVLIKSPLEAISESVQVLNAITLVLSVLAAVVGCLLAWLYASKFSRPIIAISRHAKRVAALDFSAGADENSSTAEIADLAVSINSMSSQLENFISQLMEKNRQLAEDNLRLAREEEMRRSFVANVSHDLKSPLAVVGGYAEMLKEGTAGIDPQVCCDVIIEEIAVMDGMISSMLEVSALENGLRQLQTEPLELAEWLEEICAVEQPLLEKKKIAFSRTLDPDLAVEADSELLLRAVQNILQNAATHTAEGGRVAVTLTREGSMAVLAVYNDGETIPPEKLDKIWESFYKTNEARTRDGNANVGLGLYIVRSITVAHGGRCEARNTENGVEFRILLPMRCPL